MISCSTVQCPDELMLVKRSSAGCITGPLRSDSSLTVSGGTGTLDSSMTGRGRATGNNGQQYDRAGQQYGEQRTAVITEHMHCMAERQDKAGQGSKQQTGAHCCGDSEQLADKAAKSRLELTVVETVSSWPSGLQPTLCTDCPIGSSTASAWMSLISAPVRSSTLTLLPPPTAT